MNYAPIVLFAYNRVNHTRQTVEALLNNELASDSDLIIFSDAAQTIDKQLNVNEVRTYLDTIKGFRSITIYHRPCNYGLARSIIEGVSEILKVHERVIVLEDDLVTAPYFLRYMNEALEKYSGDDRVVSIHGWLFPSKIKLPEAFFIRGAECWGWATWKRGWAHFNPDGSYLMNELKRLKLIREFDYNGSHCYSKMLEDQIKGYNDSWAVRWYASAFLANKFTLHPGRNLVFNIGCDMSGTHCGETDIYDSLLSNTPIDLSQVDFCPSISGRLAMEFFLRKSQKGLSNRVLGLLARIKKIII